MDSIMKINNKKEKIYASNDKNFFQLLILAIVIFLIISLLKPDKFLSTKNFLSMMAQFPQYGLMTFGVMFAMLIGGIDLSIVSIANLASISAALIMTKNITNEMTTNQIGMYIILSIIVAIIVGILAGMFNGFVVSAFKVPAMLATIGTAQIFEGISLVITQGKSISGLPRLYSEVGSKNIASFIPLSLLIFVICVIILAFLLNKTSFGKQLYMLGTNENAALFSGIKVKTYKVKSFVISGVLASIAGLIMMSRTNSAKADYGESYTMQCIMIAILGGVSPDGGAGKVGSVTVAIIIVQFISSAINMFPSMNNYMKILIWGCTLICTMIWRKLSVVYKERKA